MSVDASAPRSRRALLSAAAAAAGAAAAASLGRPMEAKAANGDPFILGQGNTAADPTRLDGRLEVRAINEEDPAIVAFDDSPAAFNAAVDGISANGTGVRGQTDGADGMASVAVTGIAYHPLGIGVSAINVESGSALAVHGKARFLTRSGRATVAAGRASVDVDLRSQGGLGGTPLGFATLTSYRPGVFVTAFRPNTPVAGKARIYLNKAVTSKTSVAWFVLN